MGSSDRGLETALDIREVSASDRAAVLAITLEAYAQYADLMEERDWGLYRRHIETTLASCGDAIHLVAAEHDVLRGSVLLYPAGKVDYKTKGAKSGGYPEIRLLAVPPTARGKGVGQRLMDACLERARQSGARQVGLHTMAPMAAARRMYARMGFRPVKELDFQPFPRLAAEAFVLDL